MLYSERGEGKLISIIFLSIDVVGSLTKWAAYVLALS